MRKEEEKIRMIYMHIINAKLQMFNKYTCLSESDKIKSLFKLWIKIELNRKKES